MTDRGLAQTYAPPVTGDYGGAGPFEVFLKTFTHPVYPTANGQTLTVSVYHPGAVLNPSLPTVFMAHGFSSPVGEAASYSALLTNVASQGYNVVFAPYEGGVGLNIAMRFDELVTGFSAAVANYGLNTARVGFVGHSYGAGFLPAVIRHLMMGKASQFRAGHSWGGTAAFMFSMAPGYAFSGNGETSVKNTQAIHFPANLNVVVQVFYDDAVVNDPRVAMDIFYNITTLNSQKDFLTVYGDSHGTPAQVANHFLPNTGANVPSTSLQAWAILRHVDALAAWTFAGDVAAREIALGNGAPAQIYQGSWSDGASVVPLGVTDIPAPVAYPPSSGFGAVFWTSAVNPRGAFPLVSGPPRIRSFQRAASQASLVVDGLLVDHRYRLQRSPDLSQGSWIDGTEFTATSTSQTLTDGLPNASRQFWRVSAP
jgi:hypothetical protein